MTTQSKDCVPSNAVVANAQVVNFGSAAIERLMAEIRLNEPSPTSARYDRAHNRHNR